MPMRKAKLSPSFSLYLERLKKHQPLELVLRGHLVIEALLVELIQLQVANDRPWKWDFPSKVRWCVDKSLIPAERESCYLHFNDIRNDFAHILGHELTFDDLHDLLVDMAQAGYDFSDDTIYSDRELSEKWYGMEGALQEIINEFYFELAFSLHDHGGPDRLSG